MDSEALHKVQVWAQHGTPKQFLAEISGKIAPHGYSAELQGNTLTCYKAGKQGGFLGIGKRQFKEPVLQIIYETDRVVIPEEKANAEFISLLASLLKVH